MTTNTQGDSNARPLSITQVSTADIAGGAERVALDIHRHLLALGYDATLAIGHQYASFPRTAQIPNDSNRSIYTQAITKLMPKGAGPHGTLSPTQVRIRHLLKVMADPLRSIRTYQGYDDFDLPGTSFIPNLSENHPDVIHLHNLHGNYFDLRELPNLCTQAPIMLTAHDTWLASGHCAYSVDCNKYLDGCGSCEHLDYIPRALGDKTHENWLLKKAIFQDPKTRIHLVSPSQWTIDILQNSIFSDAIVSTALIPNGVDTSVFKPADKLKVRQSLGINPDSMVLTFSLASESNPYKDLKTIKEALPAIGRGYTDKEVIFIAIGATNDQAPNIPGVTMKYTGYLSSPQDVAAYLQAADIHLHAAHAEVFCLAIIEAEACGTPVITTDVGGTADTIINNTTGMLVPRKSPHDMAEATLSLLRNPAKLESMSTAAATHVLNNLTQDLMVERYCQLYRSISHNE